MLKENWKAIVGEFTASAFIGFWGLGFIIPFAVLGYISNMHEFAVWFGVVFALAIIAFAPISGAHVNPGITLAWAIFKGFNKKLIIPYWIAQILGWGVGIAPLYIIFDNVLDEWAKEKGGNPATLFLCSSPSNHLLAAAALEILLTALMTFSVFMLIEKRLHGAPSAKAVPWAIGVVISLTIAFGGGFSGACINAARDLGPRIVSLLYGLIKGYDVSSVFAGWQWLMYLVAPCIGAVIGGFFHYGVILKLLPSKES